MRRFLLFSGIGIAAALAFAGMYVFIHIKPTYAEAQTIGRDVASFQDLQMRFQMLAKDKGAEYAYDILRRARVPPGTDLHLLGHAVGEILYEQKGVDGIADCTQEFRNACSHAIVIGALAEFGGEQALDRIRDACSKAPGGPGAYTMCYHGLGHGVFAFFQYDFPKTIDFCKKTGTSEHHDREYVECVGGAVMELIGGGGHDMPHWLEARDKYLTRDPLSPCMSAVVPADVKPICLTYLTPRLFAEAGADLASPDPSAFPAAFGFCAAIPAADTDLRDACYGGFGKEFVPLAAARDIRAIDAYTDAQLSTVATWCDAAGNEAGASACIRSEVDSLFWGGENDPRLSQRFCALLAESVRSRACYSALALDIASWERDPVAKSALCADLPEEYRTTCAGTGFAPRPFGETSRI